MKIIIDTHALLWFFSNHDDLSEKARRAIENSSNDVFVSIASFWEISIKLSLSKIVIPLIIRQKSNNLCLYDLHFQLTQFPIIQVQVNPPKKAYYNIVSPFAHNSYSLISISFRQTTA